MARNAMPSSSLSAVSSFRRQTNPTATPSTAPSRTDQAKEIKCPECHTTFKIFTEGSRGWNTTPHQLCITCYRERHRRKRQQRLPQQRSPQSPSSAVQAVESDSISQVAALHIDHPRASCHSRRRRPQTHLHNSRHSVLVTPHPWQRPSDPAEVPAIADTGAQSDLLSLDSYPRLRFSHWMASNLSASAYRQPTVPPLALKGRSLPSWLLSLAGGEIATCHSMVYVSSSVKSMYLSYESLLNLGLLPHTFPSIDDDVNQQRAPRTAPSVNATREIK
ncbi:hypothetical protein QZH41_011887 [Actinostola sp. cb2023]|nr:hypothetical protein QZH41_011887 [Actinostola sp. cb2023]